VGKISTTRGITTYFALRPWLKRRKTTTMHSIMENEPIIQVTPAAIEKIVEYRDQEPGDEEYGLLVEITGIRGYQFAYDLSFVPVSEREDTDHIHRYGDLAVIVPDQDVEKLRGAVLDMSSDPLQPGMVMNNPNSPSPAIAAEVGELEGSVAEKVQTVLEQHVNPAIASHGGAAELVGVEGETAYLRLMGGCQGCGMAAVTLREGIERLITEAVPEITRIGDVTDHASGTNPYYEPAAK
jgi:Fe/S biogenesis protein NfuA